MLLVMNAHLGIGMVANILKLNERLGYLQCNRRKEGEHWQFAWLCVSLYCAEVRLFHMR